VRGSVKRTTTATNGSTWARRRCDERPKDVWRG
jgi:hypothetical protein